MKFCLSLLSIITVLGLTACSGSINGVGASVGQQHYSPYTSAEEGTAVVYIYWNQRDIERYVPFGTRKPTWNTYVNRKKNAELDEGSYSVVEVKPGRATIEARARLGANSNISDRGARIGLSAKPGETYYIRARLIQGSLGLELNLEREISEREAYNHLYGLRYQENLQNSMIY